MATAKKKNSYGSGSIYYVEKLGVWIGSYDAGITPEGKRDRKTVRGKSEKEVRRKLKALSDELNKTDYVYVQRETFATYITQWMTSVKRMQLKERSYDRLEQTVTKDVIPYIGNIQLASVSTEHIQQMIADLKDAGRAYSSIKKAYEAVNAAFKWGLAVHPPKVKYNPATAVARPNKKVFPPSDIRFYTEDEARKISETALFLYGR